MECLALSGYMYFVAVASARTGVDIESGLSQISYRIDQTSVSVETDWDTAEHVIHLKDHDSEDTVRLKKYNPMTLESWSEWYTFNLPELMRSCK